MGHPPEKGWYLSYITETKKLIDEFGGKKDIWITETGWPTNIGFCEGWMGVSLDEQAKYLVRSIVLLLSLGVKRIFWFSARNGGEDVKNFEHNQGLLYYDKKPKPSYFAYTTLIKMLEGTKFIKKINIPKIYSYLFEKDNKGCFILWTTGRNVKLNFKNLPDDVRVFDINGNEIKINDKNLQLSDSPIYVVTSKIKEFENSLIQNK